MNITTDKETFINADMVRRGLADVVPLKVTFQGKPEDQTTAMNGIEAHFKVYQYRKGNGVEFGDHELFFWCNSIADSTPGNYQEMRRILNTLLVDYMTGRINIS